MSDTSTVATRWASYINGHGGLDGHPVQIIFKDDQGTGATGLQDFEELQSDGVDVISDDSAVDKAWEKQADAAHIPVVENLFGGALGPYGGAGGSDANFFPIGQPNGENQWDFPKAAQLGGYKKLGFLYCAESPICAQEAPLIKSAAPAYGVDLSYATAFSNSAPNYTAQCVGAQQSGADILFIAGITASSTYRLLSDCSTQKYHPALIIYTAVYAQQMFTDKDITAGIGLSNVEPAFANTPGMATFRSVMNSYLPQANSIFAVTINWAAMQVIGAAAQHLSATPTPQDIYQGLYTFKNNTLDGVTPPLTYTQGQINPPPDCAFFFKYTNTNGSNPQFSSPAGTAAICQTPPSTSSSS